MAAPKVYLSPAMHRANPCVYPRPDGKQCYEALENNEYIDILEPVLNRCGIVRTAAALVGLGQQQLGQCDAQSVTDAL